MERSTRILCLFAMLANCLSGCNFGENRVSFNANDAAHYAKMARQIEYPDPNTTCGSMVEGTPAPLSITAGPPEFWDMKLEEAIRLALTNSKVMQDMGGLVLRSPTTVQTIHGPAIQETDPRFGVEAALSEFDAVFSSSVRAEKNDRALNNVFFGGGTRLLEQDLLVMRSELAKRTATGATFIFRNNMDYDANNSPGNLFPSAWNVNYEAEVRQPLLRGAGVEYNRIAGPGQAPGVVNGVLIARVNTDISLADFERSVRDLVSNVESAYWDLYFAYRDLDARTRARDAALNSWREVNALNLAGRRGGEADREAEAREQYFRFQDDVQNALNGRLVEGTQTNNGSGGGTFRGNGGVRVAERRLRLMLCLPINEMRVIRPAEEPNIARLTYDWDQMLSEATMRRVELRRQKWVIKRREMELIAAKNFLLPELDSVGLYRWRGFGKDLLDPDRDGRPLFDNAYGDLATGDFQEWQLGLQLTVPLGARRAHAAVRNAQLLLARERAVLQDQELQVVHDLSNAVADVERAFDAAQNAFNRRVAARQQVGAVQAAFEGDKVPLFNVLDAQRRAVDSEIRYFASLVEYAIAVKNVHFEKGSLLDYNDVYLAESPSPAKAYKDASLRQPKKRSFRMNYLMSKPPAVSAGPYAQMQAIPPQVTGVAEVTGEQIPPGLQLPPGAVIVDQPSATPPGATSRPVPMNQVPMNQGQGPATSPVRPAPMQQSPLAPPRTGPATPSPMPPMLPAGENFPGLNRQTNMQPAAPAPAGALPAYQLPASQGPAYKRPANAIAPIGGGNIQPPVVQLPVPASAAPGMVTPASAMLPIATPAATPPSFGPSQLNRSSELATPLPLPAP